MWNLISLFLYSFQRFNLSLSLSLSLFIPSSLATPLPPAAALRARIDTTTVDVSNSQLVRCFITGIATVFSAFVIILFFLVNFRFNTKKTCLDALPDNSYCSRKSLLYFKHIPMFLFFNIIPGFDILQECPVGVLGVSVL